MIKNIVFDFGGVLIDWNPRYLYKNLFDTIEEMEYFLENICTNSWNEQQDAGRSIIEATTSLQNEFPEYEKMIQHYYDNWEKMLNGGIEENVRLLALLKNNYKLLGLTNWSSETYPIAQRKFPFLQEFEGILVSGEEKMKKPDKEIFNLLLSRYQIKANESLFIDDSIKNIQVAKEIGFQTIHYTTITNLEDELKTLKLI